MALIKKTVSVEVEIDISDIDTVDLMHEMEENGFTMMPDCPQELIHLLIRWFQRPLPDQMELAEWLRTHQ